jgi:hypothetical protein
MIINASIKKDDLDKLDPSVLIQGKTAVYIPLAIYVDDKLDKFGNNVSVQLAQSQDDRAAKKPKVYLGNGKVVYVGDMPKTAKEIATKEPF